MRGNILLERNSRLATMTFSNLGARNAMSVNMMRQLVGHVDELCQNPPSVLILRGDGVLSFCSGGDLADVKSSLLDKGHTMSVQMTALTNKMFSLPMLTLAAVEGAAIGGGAELLTGCDCVFAGKNAKIQFAQVKLGVTTGWGGGSRLISRLGKATALKVLMGKKYSSQELYDLGWFEAPVEDGHAYEQAVGFSDRALSIDANVFKNLMSLIREPEREIEIFASLWGGEVHRKKLGL